MLILVLVGQLTYLQVIDAEQPRQRPAQRPHSACATSTARAARSSPPTARSSPQSIADDGGEFKYQREYPLGDLFSADQRLPVVRRRQHRRRGELQRRAHRARPELQFENFGQIVSRQGEHRQRRALADASTRSRPPRTRSTARRAPSSCSTCGPARSSRCTPTRRSTRNRSRATTPRRCTSTFDLLNADPAKPALPARYRELYPPGSTFKVVTARGALDDRHRDAGPHAIPSSASFPLPGTTTALGNFGGSTCGGGTLTAELHRNRATRRSRSSARARRRVRAGHERVRGRFRRRADRAAARPRPGAVGSIGPAAGARRAAVRARRDRPGRRGHHAARDGAGRGRRRQRRRDHGAARREARSPTPTAR